MLPFLALWPPYLTNPSLCLSFSVASPFFEWKLYAQLFYGLLRAYTQSQTTLLRIYISPLSLSPFQYFGTNCLLLQLVHFVSILTLLYRKFSHSFSKYTSFVSQRQNWCTIFSSILMSPFSSGRKFTRSSWYDTRAPLKLTSRVPTFYSHFVQSCAIAQFPLLLLGFPTYGAWSICICDWTHRSLAGCKRRTCRELVYDSTDSASSHP